MSIRTIRSTGLLAACTIAGIALPAAAQELEPKVFLQTSDDLHFVKVDRQGTTCIMTFVNEKDQTGVNLLVGRTVLTNQLSLFAATDIGTHGATFELNRRTLDGVVASRTAFSKKSPKGFGLKSRRSSKNVNSSSRISGPWRISSTWSSTGIWRPC